MLEELHINSCQNCAFSALTLLVGHQEEHLTCKKTEWWDACVAICLERGVNDLHMVQQMPLSPHHLLLHWNQTDSTYLMPAYPGYHGKEAIKRVSLCQSLVKITTRIHGHPTFSRVHPQESDVPLCADFQINAKLSCNNLTITAAVY